MAKQKFIELSSHPGWTKEEVRAQYKAKGLNPRYSGMTVKDEDGKVIRGPGFYINL